jgi:hypothetical protein
MLEHERAFRLQVLVKPHPGPSASEQPGQSCLAPLEWFSPQIVTVKLQDIEGVHEHAGVVVPVADALEERDARQVGRRTRVAV